MKLAIPAYHYIGDQSYPHPGIHPIPWERFERQILTLLQSAAPLSARDLDLFPANTGSALFFFPTFDDGLKEHLRAARLLSALGVQGGFYIPSLPFKEKRPLLVHKIHWLRAHTPFQLFREGLLRHLPAEWQTQFTQPDADTIDKALTSYRFDTPEQSLLKFLLNFILPHEVTSRATSALLAERGFSEADFCQQFYLDPSELKQIHSMGHLIGAHGHEHKPFSGFESIQSLRTDVNTNLELLGQLLGANPDSVAYPFGTQWALPADTETFCGLFGFRTGLTYRPGLNDSSTPKHALHRVDAVDVESTLF